MAFGNNIAERSRKTDLLKVIRMNMLGRMTLDEALTATKGWRRRTVAELEQLMRTERKNHESRTSRTTRGPDNGTG